jgi:hypothetical protein
LHEVWQAQQSDRQQTIWKYALRSAALRPNLHSTAIQAEYQKLRCGCQSTRATVIITFSSIIGKEEAIAIRRRFSFQLSSGGWLGSNTRQLFAAIRNRYYDNKFECKLIGTKP